MRVFLGGTCNEPDWRDQLIPKLTISYFNPVVEDWTPECQEIEKHEKNKCDILLYIITPYMTGVYSVAEAIQDSNRRPHKTIFCVLDNYQGKSFTASELKSLEAVCDLVRENGATVLYELDDVAAVINNFKKLPSMDINKYYPVFLDTEFTDLKQDCKLISLGITDIKGNTFYAETNCYTTSDCSVWVRDNIIPTLKYNGEEPVLSEVENNYSCKGTLEEIRERLMQWFKHISGGKQILVISDCLAYDWVLFSELIRKANSEFPSDEVFYVPVDIMGILISRGLDIDITREDLVNMSSENKHNSLHDAEVIREIWKRYL